MLVHVSAYVSKDVYVWVFQEAFRARLSRAKFLENLLKETLPALEVLPDVPPEYVDETLSKQLTTHTDETTFQRLKTAAARSNWSLSRLVRVALTIYRDLHEGADR